MFADQFGEVDACDELHRDVEGAGIGGAEVEDLDAIGVVETAGGFSFALETASDPGIFHEVLVEEFDSDFAVDRFLDRPIDTAHRALADEFFDPEFSDDQGVEKGIFLFRRA